MRVRPRKVVPCALKMPNRKETMSRVTNAEVYAVFQRFAAACGRTAFVPGDGQDRYRDTGVALHHLAGWSLDYAAPYGGWTIASHDGTGTGEGRPFGVRMPTREFVAAMRLAIRAIELSAR